MQPVPDPGPSRVQRLARALRGSRLAATVVRRIRAELHLTGVDSGVVEDVTGELANLRQSHDALVAQVGAPPATEPSPLVAARLASEELRSRIALHEARLRALPPDPELVSVVIATRHRPERLARALRSLVAQTHEHWEALVVDDGDEVRHDEVLEVLEALDDSRIRVLRSRGGNASAARNVGLDAARGDLVAYLDDDNVLFPVWLAAVVDAAGADSETPLFYGARVEGAEGAEPALYLAPFERRALERFNYIDTGAIAHRSDHVEARWDENLVVLGDWDLALRLTEEQPGRPVPALAVGYTTDAPDRLSERSEMRQVAWQSIEAKVRSRRPMRVLAVNQLFPLLSETYVADELAALSRHGARIGYVRTNRPVAPMTVDGPLWSDIATGVREFEPDLLLLHWVGVAMANLDVLSAVGLPFAVRAHGFDIAREPVDVLLAHPLCLGVWAYPTAAQGFPGTYSLPLLFTSAERLPAPAAVRDLVLSTSAGLPKKDFDLLFAAMDLLPGVERRIVVAGTEKHEGVPGELLLRCQAREDPPLVQVNLPREDVFRLLGRTALHIYTLDPAHPFGMPMAVAEAMAAGASVVLPDRPEARSYAGPGALFYTTAEDIARHARAVLAGGARVEAERAANRDWALKKYAAPELAERFYAEITAAVAAHNGAPPMHNGNSRILVNAL